MMNRRSFLLRTTVCLFSIGWGSRPKNIHSSREISAKKARFFRKGENEFVHCELCFRGCTIADKKRGFCRARENRSGELHSLVYGKPAGLQIDPIELEPMYHMVPGHRNLCVYTASCNFRCKHCHNWSITQFPPERIRSLEITPDKIVEEAIKQGCQSISHSINEPTIFYEMMHEVAQIAKKRGLLTLCHTNGGIKKTPLLDLLQFLDGVTVDLKAFTPKFYEDISEAKIEPVLETLLTIRSVNKHLEIVNLIIPTLNDNLEDIKKMSRWIAENLGRETPVHFTRFSPSHKMTHLPPTPIKTLEEARAIAMAEGMRFVYIGNVVGHPANSTYCSKCGRTLIERTHFIVRKNWVEKGFCPFCGEKIPGIWNVA